MESVGTTLAGCSTNRTCLTISMPQQSSWSKTATQAGNIWPFRVAPMVGCWWQLASIKGLIFTRRLLCKLGMSFYNTVIIWGLVRDRSAGQMVEVWLRMCWQFILSNEDKFFGQLNINWYKFVSFTNDYNNYRKSCWASVPGIINSYSKLKSLKQTERIKFQTKLLN